MQVEVEVQVVQVQVEVQGCSPGCQRVYCVPWKQVPMQVEVEVQVVQVVQVEEAEAVSR
jgi:hypothetical protein